MAMRIMPHNLDAEQSIIGALLFDPNSLDQVADIIRTEDFYKTAHQILFATVKELHSKGEPIDIITVTNLLNINKQTDMAGGTEYLAEVLNKTVSSVNIIKYAQIVKDNSLLRKLIGTGTRIVDRAYEHDFENVSTFIDHVEAEVYKLGENTVTSGLVSADELVKTSVAKIEELFNRGDAITGIPTGFSELDKMLTGLQPGELSIIAARPSMGKTAFSLNVAQHMVLREKKTVAYFSIEMSKETVMMRVLASESRINLSDVKTGRIPESAWGKFISVAGQISEAPLFLDDTNPISPFEIRARCRRLKAKHQLDAIIIDYLQLMELKEHVESREREVAEISRSLKSIAKELQVPVIALAQLNRGVESRGEKRPMLSDLRESGSIEQDADVIMMLYREDYYSQDDQEKLGLAEVIVAKNRNGPTGIVKLRWEAKVGRFRDHEGDAPPLPPLPSQPHNHFIRKPKNFAPGANQ